ncbi:MAG: crotonase/enoyl-CoA hydratase family protein [Deltaproteobacteria bacterium]|nr:crotonase/enoyl-CoA hydratase family protein [Deltaproteobacteria bacterium]
MSDPKDGTISREVRGNIIMIGINRPAKRNALNWSMLMELSAAYTEYEKNPDLRCAVLYGHGDHFTSGLDLADVAPRVKSGQSFIQKDEIDPWALYGRARTKPLICAIRGYCMTVGIELSLAADIIVAASDSRFLQIEIKRGIYPFGGATIRMVQAAGWGNAMRYLLTGDEINAAEAYRIGLVQEVTEPGKELTRALEIAQTVSLQAPLGVQATLASARIAINKGVDAAAADLVPRVMKLMDSDDAREGLQAMLEKRQGRFTGK